jgi:hypothetical protein
VTVVLLPALRDTGILPFSVPLAASSMCSTWLGGRYSLALPLARTGVAVAHRRLGPGPAAGCRPQAGFDEAGTPVEVCEHVMSDEQHCDLSRHRRP